MPYVGLSDVQRGRTVALVEGLTQRDIAATMGVSQGVISKTYARYVELQSLQNRPRRSRKKITSEEQDRFLFQFARRDPSASHPILIHNTRHFLEAIGISVSVETMRQRLRSRGLYSRKPVRVPELTRQQKINRHNWCIEHQN
ncbi:hypothetical protein HHI36_001581 [Cryptolaemus montrouzieri]|uniref:Transposase Tc1-like domain-containing protein n=1 Tax=Cryptolaemus montrouzieri TaxID=559131 RepID=A0ABD2P8T1_9CUCU